jgi:hypothetical protein
LARYGHIRFAALPRIPPVRSCRVHLVVPLALLCAAGADQAGASESILPVVKPAIEDVAAADAAPVLDLRFDPPLAAEQQTRTVVPQTTAAGAARETEGAFSVGLDIKTRRAVGSPAARATAERSGPLTLTDKVEGIVERSAFGLTGKYRF